MTSEEILGDQIGKLKQRYLSALQSLVESANIEHQRVATGMCDQWGLMSLKEANDVLALNNELRGLLCLKDRIANQAREKEPTP